MPAPFIQALQNQGKMNLVELKELFQQFFQPTYRIGDGETQFIFKGLPFENLTNTI